VPMSRRIGLPLVVTMKAAVIGLTALGAFGGLERFEEKGFGWRLIWYPAMILLLPVIWRLVGRGPYPYLADALITLPFLVDVVGNVLNLYDTITWWDDLNHFVNWFFLSLGIGVLLLRSRFEPIVLAAFVIAFGATSAIVWELGEYATFIRTNKDEFDTAYTDTLGDLALDLVGALLAASITFYAARRRDRATAAQPAAPASAMSTASASRN
jgi:hypothetical protein